MAEKAEKPTKDVKAAWTADLDLTAIRADHARYRVVSDDWPFDFHHVIVPKKFFPFGKDPDFNLDFIRSDLVKAPRDLQAKQARFNEYVKLEVIISTT